MNESAENSLARLLDATSHGDDLALEQLMELVYKELRALAAYQLKKERPNHTLQPTALVHEAYVRLIEQQSVDWQGRAHFFRVAARQIDGCWWTMPGAGIAKNGTANCCG